MGLCLVDHYAVLSKGDLSKTRPLRSVPELSRARPCCLVTNFLLNPLVIR